MAENWDFYLCLIEDQPASIYLDMEWVKRAPVPRFDHFGYLRLYMREARPDGLSSNEEFETLRQIENALEPAVTEACEAHYVGRTTSDGARTFYFYVADAEAFERAATRAAAVHTPYEFDLGCRSDPDWSVYRDFLYPSPGDRHRMRNRKVLESLRDEGDDGSAVRQIDHWTYFPRREDALAFARHVEAQGFSIFERAEFIRDQCYRVRFHRMDRPFDINAIMAPLIDRAAELAGEYDGWECPVEKPD